MGTGGVLEGTGFQDNLSADPLMQNPSVLLGMLLEYRVDFSFLFCQWEKAASNAGLNFFHGQLWMSEVMLILSVQLMFGLLSDPRSPTILQPAAEATVFITPPSVHSCANPVTLYTAKK